MYIGIGAFIVLFLFSPDAAFLLALIALCFAYPFIGIPLAIIIAILLLNDR